MPLTTLAAKDVSEMLLARTGEALLSGDFDSFVTCFSVPYALETFQEQRTLTSHAAFRETFDAVRNHLTQQRVTLMARHCVSAEFRSQDEIAATHETRLISDGILIQDPYPALSVLERGADGAWRIISTSYMILDSVALNNALNG